MLVRKFRRRMRRRTDPKTLSAKDVVCCLDVNEVPFAIKVEKTESY